MTPEQQRIAIAEACGWDCDPYEAHGWESRGQWVKQPKEFPHVWPYKKGDMVSKNCYLPDYLNDLNAMHEAEKALNTEQLARYNKWLAHICTDNYSSLASAAQRAEAFLKTLDLYK